MTVCFFFILFIHIHKLPKFNIAQKVERVSTSRIDYDKHIEILLDTNQKLKAKQLKPIQIYGAKNDLYVYRKLKELDSMNEKDSSSAYNGRFEKSFEAIHSILKPSKYMIDLSAIKDDGGGSQYTFLEAIYENCALVISNKWTEGTNSVYHHGENSFVISNSDDLVSLLENNRDVSYVTRNALKLLKPHIDVDWKQVFL